MTQFLKTLILSTWLICSLVYAGETIEIVVPFAAGGTTDMIAREIQQEITSKSNIKTVIINKPGADGVIAGQYFLSNQSNKILVSGPASSLYLKLGNPNTPYDPINDFQIIGPLVTTSTVLVVSNKSKIKNLDEFIQVSRKQNLNCGASNAVASFIGKYFANTYASNLTIVPYRSAPLAMADLQGGHIDCVFDSLPVYVGQPNFTVIGVSVPDGSNRFSAPVMFKADFRFENYFGIALGKTVDPQLREQLSSILINLHKNKDFSKILNDRGFVVNPSVTINYSAKLNRDLAYLQNLNQRLDSTKK